MRSSLLLPLLWVLIGGLSATLTETALAQLHHTETILESDGLPSPDVKSITQDSLGRMWIATRGGLAFHNGLTWESIDLDSLGIDPSQGLLQVDHQGQVWALMSGNKPALLRHVSSRWEAVPLPPGLTGSYREFSGFLLSEANGQTVVALFQKPNIVHVSTADGWQQIPLADNGVLKVTALNTFAGDFILAAPQGVFAVPATDPMTMKPLSGLAQAGTVESLCPNRLDNSLWMAGSDWIGKFADGHFSLLLPPQGQVFPCFVDSPIRICQTDDFGGMYLSGGYCTQYFHPTIGQEAAVSATEFLDAGAKTLFLDREQVLWQGTANGITKIISRHLTGFTRGHGLLSNEMTALLRRKDGTLVIGHNNGLTLWNNEIVTIPFPDPDLRDRVLDLAEDSRGNVWIAGRQRGLGKLSADGSLQWWALDSEMPNYFSSVLVDEQDRVWITAGNKLLIREKGDISEVSLPTIVEKNIYMRRLIKGRDGSIIIATGNRGVITIKGDKVQQWTTGLKDRGNSVYDVLETPEGLVWAATRNGLYQLDGGRLARPADSRFFVDRPVYFLEIDQQDRLWLGTDNGVVRISESRVDHFTVENGLIGRETNRCASLLDPDGRMWVGTESGLTVFNDLFENHNPLPPLVSLSRLEAGGKSFPLFPGSGNIALANQSENLVFQYAVFSTRESKRLQVRTKLDGFDSDWVQQPSAGEQVARYSHLPPGTYRFHVQAAGPGQPWSEVQSSPEIVLPAPVWQRAWFLILVAISVLAIISFPIVFFLQRRYTTRLKQEVEKQVAANLRIENELDQSRHLRALGVVAGGLAHDFNNLLTIIFGNLSLLEDDKNLDAVQQQRLTNATSAIERTRNLTNKLLTFARGGAPILAAGSIANLVRENADFVIKGSGTRCRFQFPDDLWAVVMDSAQISQVVNDLLVNAQEAMSHGGEIVIAGRNLSQCPVDSTPGKFVEITIKDNGPGIDPGILTQIFEPYFSTKEKSSGLGLATAFSIMKRHQGKLTVESTLGQGSTFHLIFPASDSTPRVEPETGADSRSLLQGDVLLLDDDPEVRDSLGKMLNSLGFEVEETAEGKQTLDQYRQRLDEGRPFRIVLMDLTIPGGLGGQDIIDPLLKMDPQAKAVIISGYSHDPVISQFKQYGFQAAITKPIMVDELGRVMRQVLAP
jgi:signal transduction histidine kinase/ligand-binding sensor domain-containing protein